MPKPSCSFTLKLYISSSERFEDMLSVTCGMRSKPTTSNKPNIPDYGAPIGRPMIASASSTVKPSLIASIIPTNVQ